MGYEDVVESQIQDAMARGVFENLDGQGRPFEFDEAGRLLAGANWVGYKIMRDSRALPEWLELGREIEAAEKQLQTLDARHAELIALTASLDDWDAAAPAITHITARYETAARALRALQDNFNVKAPGIRSERPAIWVERQLERLRQRAIDAGAP